MTKRTTKKPEAKPTPPVAIDKSETLARDSRDELPPAVFALKGEVCPICGTVRTANACPVDGHRFEVTK